VHLFTELLSDRVRVLGPDHPQTLDTRRNIAASTRSCGDLSEALRLFTEQLPDVNRVRGPNHPYTDSIQNSIAECRQVQD
jgi:hypothetical protein